MEVLGEEKVKEVIKYFIENNDYFEFYLFCDNIWDNEFKLNLKEYLEKEENSYLKDYLTEHLKPDYIDDKDDDNKYLKFCDEKEKDWSDSLEHRYIDLTKDEKIEIAYYLFDRCKINLLTDFSNILYMFNSDRFKQFFENPFSELILYLSNHKMKNLAFKLINLPYQFKCWKCEKIMEIVPDETNYWGVKKPNPSPISVHRLTEGIGKDYFLSLHNKWCGCCNGEIGCCTCDGSIHSYFASCAEHSTEILEKYREYRASVYSEGNIHLMSSHLYLVSNYPDLAIKPT
jgi:hypothetical protein